jgi:hypothetical protein
VKDYENEPLASILIGAYMIIRGLSFFFGGFPNEAKTLTNLSNDNLLISGSIYLYFFGFLALVYAGYFVQ